MTDKNEYIGIKVMPSAERYISAEEIVKILKLNKDREITIAALNTLGMLYHNNITLSNNHIEQSNNNEEE